MKENKATGEALTYWLKKTGLKQAELAEKIGVEQGTISNMKRGARDIKGEYLEKISEAFGITLSEFFTMGAAELPDTVFIPLLKARPRGGTGGLEVEPDIKNMYAFHRSFIERKGGTGDSMKLFHVMGDSMEPTLKSGDMVMINQSQREVVNGNIYLLRFEGDLMIKRLIKKPGGVFTIKSDNEVIHPPIDISPTDESLDIEIFGRMVWSCREY